MNRLIFRGDGWPGVRKTLLRDSPLEAAAMLLANRGQGLEGLRLVVHDIVLPADDDYSSRSEVGAVLNPAFVAAVLKRARHNDQSVVLVHSHPFQDQPEFSLVDDRGEAVLAPTMYGRVHQGPHGALVVGRTSFRARFFDRAGEAGDEISVIAGVGPDVRIERANPDVADPAELYDRNVRAFGRGGQLLLSGLHVAVVGVGGTGSFAVEELARLGVGRLTLIDNEAIETTNLNRVLGSRAVDVGRPKVEVAAEAARRANPNVGIRAIAGSVVREGIARALLDCDFVFCCTDSHGSRAVVNQVAYQFLVPTIDVGVRIDAQDERVAGVTTRMQMLAPGLACLACHPLLDPDAVRRDLMTEAVRKADPYIVGVHEPQPAVISINGAATSAAITIFLSAVAGLPGRARHIVGRPLEGVTRPVVSTPRSGCVVCDARNALARADNWRTMWLPGTEDG